MNLFLNLSLNLLIFARSISERNFSLYVSSLKQVVKGYYACYHYHYARWVTVHLYDLVNLPTTLPYLYKCFSDDCFAFQKSNKKFSLMGIDQPHEQNNAVIKSMGGATSVLKKDDESGLARWELYSHELTLIINEYESNPETEIDFKPLKYHEDSEAFQNQFSAHVSQLKTSILTNSFKLNKLTVLNNEKASFNDIVSDDISKMSKLGKEQLKAFWMNRLLTRKISVSDPTLLNSLNLPGNPVLTAAMTEKFKKASEARIELVESLLCTEIFEIPQSLSANQYSLYHGTKSHVTSRFRAISKPSCHVMKSGIVIELSMLLRKKRVANEAKTMRDFLIMS